MIWNTRPILVIMCLFGYWTLADFVGVGLDGPVLLFARFAIAMATVGVFWYLLEKRGW